LTDLSQVAVVDVEYEAPDLGCVDEGAGVQGLERRTHVLFHVTIGAQLKRRSHPEVVRDPVGEGRFLERFETAAGVVDNHHDSSSQQPLAEEQRANCVVAGEPAGVSNQVRLTEIEPEGAEEVESGVHARQNGQVELWHRRHLAMAVSIDVGAIVGDEFVDYAHRFILGDAVKADVDN